MSTKVFIISFVVWNKFIMKYMKNISFKGQSWRSGTRCDYKTDWVRSSLEEIKYLFPFFRSGVEVKRGVEFYHEWHARNVSRIRQKVGNGVS